MSTTIQTAYDELVMRERDLHAAQKATQAARNAMAAFCPVKVGERFEVDGSLAGRACKLAIRVVHVAVHVAVVFAPPWSATAPLQWRIRGLVLKKDGTEGTRMVEADLPVDGINIAPEHQL